MVELYIYQVGQNVHLFFCTIALGVLSCLYLHLKQFYCDSHHISVYLKNLPKLVTVHVAILILKMEENMQHFWHIVLYYFKKDKDATETQKRKICATYGEGAVTD